VRDELPFRLSVIEIDGDQELEQSYRELLPVVEIDGRRAFVYHVPADALRERLREARAHGS